MGFVKVYAAPTPFEAHLVRSLFENRGVPAQVRNDTFSPYGTVLPEVWVEERYAETIREVLSELAQGPEEDGQLSLAEPEDQDGAVSIPEDGESGPDGQGK